MFGRRGPRGIFSGYTTNTDVLSSAVRDRLSCLCVLVSNGEIPKEASAGSLYGAGRRVPHLARSDVRVLALLLPALRYRFVSCIVVASQHSVRLILETSNGTNVFVGFSSLFLSR